MKRLLLAVFFAITCICVVIYVFIVPYVNEKKDNEKYIAWVEDYSGRYGYVSKNGEEVIPCKYDYAESFDGGYARVGIVKYENDEKYSLYGLIDKNGKEILSCQYDNITMLGNCIEVRCDEKLRLCDFSGNVISSEYDFIFDIYNTDDNEWVYIVELDDKVGCISEKGDELIPLMYDMIFWMHTEENKILLTAVDEDDDATWLYNTKGEKLVCLGEYSKLLQYNSCGLIPIKEGDKYGYVDYAGNIVLPIIYDQVTEFGNNGLALISKDGWTYVIDTKGEIKSQCEKYYYGIWQFDTCGLAVVRDSEEKYGAINEYGEEVIPCEYKIEPQGLIDNDCVFFFDENGMAIIRENSKYGVINQHNIEVVHPYYDDIEICDNGLIIVEEEEKYGVLDLNGNIVLPIEYDDVYMYSKRSFSEVDCENVGKNIIAIKHNKMGLFNIDGKEIFPCKYESFDRIDKKGNFVAYLDTDQKSPVLLNISGKEIISQGYDKIGSYGEDALVPVIKNNKCSFFDENGNVKMDLDSKYIKAGEFVKVYE